MPCEGTELKQHIMYLPPKFHMHAAARAALALLCLLCLGSIRAAAQVSYPQFVNSGQPAQDSANYTAALAQYDQQKAASAQALARRAPAAATIGSKGAVITNAQAQPKARQLASQSCIIPRDASWTKLAIGDDNSSGAIPLGFNFDLYGVTYNTVYVNNNGNLTFTQAYGSYSSTGFPFAGVPMVAPFWADVDTRGPGNTGCGGVYYKNFGTRFVVTWENVGYYNAACDKSNTFQVVISTTSDPVVGLGQNVKFNFGDMNWTTGSASGGAGGFGGTAATAGVNKGADNAYIQIGRFGFAGIAYDGGAGATDGVDFLDYECYSFNVSNANNIPPSFSGLPSGNTLTLNCGQSATVTVSSQGPEVNQTVTDSVSLNGMCGVTASVNNSTVAGGISTATLNITAGSCNIGTNTITITATDNGTPARTSTATLTVIVNGPTAPVISGPTQTCPGTTVTLTASGGSDYEWSNGATTASIQVGAGTYSVVATSGSCTSAPATITVTDADNTAPVPTQATLPTITATGSVSATAPTANDACSGTITATATGPAFFNTAGTHTIHWVYDDGHGNTSAQDQTVVVVDSTAPSISCPVNRSINLSAACTVVIPDYRGLLSATDNCPGTLLVTQLPAPGTVLSGAGVILVSFEVKDAAGNRRTCNFRLTKRDVTPPTITAPAPATFIAPAGQCSIDASAVSFGSASAQDNCGSIASLANDAPAIFPVGSTVITWTARDAVGNAAIAYQIVNVVSNDAPVIVQPAPISVSSDAGNCGAAVNAATPAATSFCSNNECRTDNIDSYATGAISSQSANWTPWPFSGGSAIVSSAQSFSAPNSMRVSNDQDQLYLLGDKTTGKWELSWKMFVPAGRVAYFNSQKFGNTVAAEFGYEVRFLSNGNGSARMPSGTTAFSYPVGQWFDVKQDLDLDANTATLSINGVVLQTWTLSDRIGAVNGPGTRQLGAIDFYAGTIPGDPGAAEYFIDDIHFCGGNDATVSGVRSDNEAIGAAYPVGTTTITWTAAGGNGQSAQATQTVTVTDTEAPSVTAPQVPSIYCSNESGYTVPQPIYSDNCGIASVTYSISGATTRSGNVADASGAFNVGTSTITWTVTDIHGNSSTVSAAVVVNAPVSASIPDVWAVSPGGQANTIYQGYGPATVRLTANAGGGTAPYSYNWSNAGTTASAIVGAGNHALIVKDAFGCEAATAKTISSIDVRCGQKGDKVLVCHGTGSVKNPFEQLCVAPAAVGTLLGNGDHLGTCGGATTRTIQGSNAQPKPDAAEATVLAYPNPSHGLVSLRISGMKGALQLEVMDGRGNKVSRRSATVNAVQENVQLDLHGLAAGLYTVRISDGRQVISTRIVITR
jgi:hypothetical protein